LSTETVQKIQSAGFDCLLSAGRYLDVLPAGVAKGPTLVRLLRELALPTDRVLVAGDTMNDLSLFETGFNGVAVGNSEPDLLDAVARFPWVYQSPLPGAAGISDAIRHFATHGRTGP
jgi:hydroxymethylpyrimidine pyrophosphatase-like HAD family hydrolase